MFKELDQYLNSCDIKLSMKKKNGEITVFVEYRNEQSDLHFPPVSITGSPEALDAEFLSIIGPPTEKAAGLFHNAKHVTEQMDKIAKTAEKNKAKTTTGKKPVTPATTSDPEPEPTDDDSEEEQNGITEPAQPDPPKIEPTKPGAIKPQRRETKKPVVPASGPGFLLTRQCLKKPSKINKEQKRYRLHIKPRR